MWTHWVECFNRSKKIAGYQFRALVNQLIEGVLAVGPRFTPNDGPRAPGDRFTFSVDPFAVAFHIPLLEIGGEAVEVLVVGKDGVGLSIVKVVVPDAEQGKGHGQIFFDGCF